MPATVSTFRLSGLDAAPFEPLFLLSDAELARRGMVRRFADESPGYPCRVSLEDAAVGDELLLLSWQHQPAAASPYRASGPIFVRRLARLAVLAPGEVPPCVTRRPMSIRAYDSADLMVDAMVCDGEAVAARLDALFGRSEVAYAQLHNARQGCFSCEARREG